MFNIIGFARSAKRKISYFNLLPIIFIFLMFAACPAYAGSAPSTDILVQCNSSGVVTNNTAITGVNLPTIQYDSTGNFYLNSVDVAVYSGSTLVKELDGYTTTNLQVALGAVTNYDYNATSPIVYEIKYRGHYGVVGAGAQDITEDWKSSELYFRAISTYTITYDGNNFTGGSVPTDSNNYTTGAAITVLGNTGSLVKTGYTFGGWNTAADGSGTAYFPGAIMTMPASNVTLYAKWLSGNGKYTVTPAASTGYTIGTTPEGIATMTVNSGVTGVKPFSVNIGVMESHTGNETAVFIQLRGGVQIALKTVVADFDSTANASANFDAQLGDVVKVYIVDALDNSETANPTLLQ